MDFISTNAALDLSRRGIFTVTDDVTSESVEMLCEAILDYVDDETEEVTLLISSPGGSAEGATYFADFASLFERVKIHGIALGECSSSAFCMLQCCHTRTSLRNCAFVVHDMHSTMHVVHDGTELQQVKIMLEDSRQTSELLVDIICRRSGIRRSTWNKLAREGEKFGVKRTAQEMFKHGLLDEIIDDYPLF